MLLIQVELFSCYLRNYVLVKRIWFVGLVKKKYNISIFNNIFQSSVCILKYLYHVIIPALTNMPNLLDPDILVTKIGICYILFMSHSNQIMYNMSIIKNFVQVNSSMEAGFG